MEKGQREKEKIGFVVAKLLPALLFVLLFGIVLNAQVFRSDDFWVLQFTGHNSFASDFSFWWHHANGRFATAFLQLLLFRLPVQYIGAIAAISTLLVIFAASFHLAKTAASQNLLTKNNSFSVATFLTIAIYLSSPAPFDVFFWPSAVFVHGWSVAALLLVFSWILSASKNVAQTTIAIVSIIFIGGSSETAAIVLLMILGATIWFRPTHRIGAVLLVVVLLVASLVHYFAPASLDRGQLLAELAPRSYLHAVVASIRQNAPKAAISLIIAFIAILPVAQYLQFTFRSAIRIRIIAFIAIAAAIYTIAVTYIMRDSEPLRAAEPVFLLLLTPPILLLSANRIKSSFVRNAPLVLTLVILLINFIFMSNYSISY